MPGATLYLQAVQDLRVGGRLSNAAVSVHAAGDNLDELNDWSQALLAKLRDAAEI